MRRLRKRLALLGGAAGLAAYMLRKRRARSEPDIPDSLDNDPDDPVQGIDEVHELHVEDLGVDAMSNADVEAELEIAQTEAFADETGEEAEARIPGAPAEEPTLDTIEAKAHDMGDLYGVHTPHAEDTTHPDSDTAFDEGQNWLEALETDSIEKGPAAEADLTDVVDDDDVYAAPHPSDVKDTPVADRGSGGRGGM